MGNNHDLRKAGSGFGEGVFDHVVQDGHSVGAKEQEQGVVQRSVTREGIRKRLMMAEYDRTTVNEFKVSLRSTFPLEWRLSTGFSTGLAKMLGGSRGRVRTEESNRRGRLLLLDG